MAETVVTLAAGASKPTGFAQFGNKMIVCYEDMRPIVLMSGRDGSIVSFNAGIKPPTTPPTVPSAGLGGGYIAYCFYSSLRKVYSELSPPTEIDGDGTYIEVNGFENPRDSAFTQEIDRILFAVQLSGAPGLMFLPSLTYMDCADHVFTSKTATMSISPVELVPGINMSLASQFAGIPPAVQFCEVVGERVWYGGQRERVDLNGTLSIANATFRGASVSKLTLTGGSSWNDSHYHMVLYIDDEIQGFIWDVHSSSIAYLDKRVIAGTSTDFHLRGTRDRLWPSAWHNYGAGNIPIASPETINPLSGISAPPISDEVQIIRGMKQGMGGLVVNLNSGAMLMTDMHQLRFPTPKIQMIPGTPGSPAIRGMMRTPEGELGWIGFHGPVVQGTQGMMSPAKLTGCTRLFKGGGWIPASDLSDAVIGYCQDFDGFIIGNVSIDRSENCWLLFTKTPQPGFWLMDNQEMTSNIIQYPDDDGQAVILVGDGFNARVKRLFSPGYLLDVALASDTPTEYIWEWRGGWDRNKVYSEGDKRVKSAKYIEIQGLVLPSSEVTLTLDLWRSDYPVRNQNDVFSQNKEIRTIDQDGLLRDIPLKPGSNRYHSLAIRAGSLSGSVLEPLGRPIELIRWRIVYDD